MNDIVNEWREKAEWDFLTAARELNVTERPNYDAVCFHAQQCIEKLMKAVLTVQGIQPPRTHDLVRLNELLQSVIPSWSWPLPDLRLLDQAAVGFRYPGESADHEIAQLSFQVATILRNALRKILDLNGEDTWVIDVLRCIDGQQRSGALVGRDQRLVTNTREHALRDSEWLLFPADLMPNNSGIPTSFPSMRFGMNKYLKANAWYRLSSDE